MATAAQVLKAALQRILVQGSEAEFEPDEYQDAIFAMNNYMLDLDAKGIALGYTEVSDLGDDITVPTGALRGLIANVAIEVAPDYNGTISPGLVQAATDGLATMRLLGQSIPSMQFPQTLPIGSGNEGGHSGLFSQHFYPDLESEILAETTGCIALETGTVDAEDATSAVPTPTPSITVTSSMILFSSTVPSASTSQSYNVSGANLVGNVTLVAPVPFFMSETAGGSFTSTLVLSPVASTLNQTVYVNMRTAVVGEYDGNITHDSFGAAQELLFVEGRAGV